MPEDAEQRVLRVLEDLGIAYDRYEHPPVLTVEEAQQYRQSTGAHCKNLFLRNKKGRNHYLLILEHHKQADLKALTQTLGEDRLSFASARRLERFLGVETGAVSPFGLIHDRERAVVVLLDRDLQEAEELHFHPNVNTATLRIRAEDFGQFLAWCGNQVRTIAVRG